jgi:hypothetical protein
MRSISIISLGWLGLALYKKIKKTNDQLQGSYCNSPKDVDHQFKFDINKDDTPLEVIDSDIIILCIPPSKIIDEKQFLLFLDSISNKKIIFISSTSVYGDQGEVDELTRPKPKKRNGKRLLAWEGLIKSKFAQFQIIRSAGQYGPNRHPGAFLSGKKDIAGRNHQVNLISQEDLISIILLSIDSKVNKVVNAVNSTHPTKHNYYVDYCLQRNLIAPNFTQEDQTLNKVVRTIHSEYTVTSKLD